MRTATVYKQFTGVGATKELIFMSPPAAVTLCLLDLHVTVAASIAEMMGLRLQRCTARNTVGGGTALAPKADDLGDVTDLTTNWLSLTGWTGAPTEESGGVFCSQNVDMRVGYHLGEADFGRDGLHLALAGNANRAWLLEVWQREASTSATLDVSIRYGVIG